MHPSPGLKQKLSMGYRQLQDMACYSMQQHHVQWQRYDMWYSSKGTISGINGKVDLNLSYLAY